MTQESIVAVFTDDAEAQRARQALISSGVPERNIMMRTGSITTDAPSAGAVMSTPRERSFWDWLFGDDVPETDRNYYTTHLNDRGGTILSVMIDSSSYTSVVDILESHEVGTINVDQTEPSSLSRASAPGGSTDGSRSTPPTETVIPTAREEVNIGKQQIEDTKAYRVRRYAVTRPIEEQVTLRDETVSVERQAPGANPPIDGDPLSETEVTVTETKEIPVITKTIKPGENVVVRKDTAERTETVRDTARESRVDINREHPEPIDK